jgi:4-amino-4-deoxy-L-arabinose transferase-like glycosyltransferase
LLGIWGIARLLRDTLGTRVAAVTALALAINPSYVAMTTFDNGAVSIFMASLALVCLAISWYLRRGTNLAAFAIGLTVGFGIWARVNFAWLAIALLAAAVIVLRRRLLRIAPAQWMLAACGAVLGCLPLILYQIVSHGGTFEALGMFSAQDTLVDRLYTRLVMFSESLLCDREHRAMWSGPFMPWFERWLFPLVVFGSCLVCMAVKQAAKPASRVLSLSFLLLALTLFSSGLTVAEHHLVALLPFAAAMTAVACFALTERFPRARWAVITLAIVYAACAFQWQTAAVAGLKKTGGVGVWSDGVVALGIRLESNYQRADIKFLDWGFQQNIYTITDGRLRTREIFGDATAERSGLNRPWMEELREGGVFVLFAPGLRQIPAATTAFLAALQEYSPVTRSFSVRQRDGEPYAEGIEVEPNTLSQRKGPG